MKHLIVSIILFVVLLISIISLFSAVSLAQETRVEKDYFKPGRIIDVNECVSAFQYGKQAFLFCMNIQIICESDIVKNPKGEEYGLKLDFPEKNESGETVWKRQIWKAPLLDTESNEWCKGWHKRNPGYRPKSIKSKNPKTII